jgi:hypothetical protein
VAKAIHSLARAAPRTAGPYSGRKSAWRLAYLIASEIICTDFDLFLGLTTKDNIG